MPLVIEASGGPAVNLEKVRQAGHVNLAKAADKAVLALSKRDLAGIRAQCVLGLDHSYSMMADYRSGAVQELVARALGFALSIDVDGTMPVLAFDRTVHPAVEVQAGNHADVVNERIWKPQAMGSTNLAGLLTVVRDMAEKTTVPLYAPIVTDGEPDDPHAAQQLVCELAQYPVFLKFLAVRPVKFLSTLDDLGGEHRLLDNCDAKPEQGAVDLLSCSELEFQHAMADEWDTWTAAAKGAGVLL